VCGITYPFGEDLFGEAIRLNEQAEHGVVSITAVAEFSGSFKVTSDMG